MNRVEILSDSSEEEVEKDSNNNFEFVKNDVPISEEAESKVEEKTSSVEEEKKSEKNENKKQPLKNSWPNEQVVEAMAVANETKAKGNELYAKQDYEGAVELYSQALKESEGCEAEKGRSVFFANRAACYIGQHRYSEAVIDCNEALKIDQEYVKVLLRRAQAQEKLDKLEEALADYKKVLSIEPKTSAARDGERRLEPIVKERQEKAKEEMMSQLKGLGNTILGKFGLSLDNFQLQQDPNTGSYSVQFNQNQGQAEK